MSSRHSSLAPRWVGEPDATPRTELRARLKPRRDALTRVRHDLRSVVHSLVGYSDLLSGERYGTLTIEQARFVGHLRSAAGQLRELVDACIELSRPGEASAPELAGMQLGRLLRRLQSTLREHELTCTVEIAPLHEAQHLVADVGGLERAVLALSLVVTQAGVLPCLLTVEAHEGARTCIRLQAGAEPSSALVQVDMLENEVANRDFVRLKVSEMLLGQQGIGLHVSPSLSLVELTLPVR